MDQVMQTWFMVAVVTISHFAKAPQLPASGRIGTWTKGGRRAEPEVMRSQAAIAKWAMGNRSYRRSVVVVESGGPGGCEPDIVGVESATLHRRPATAKIAKIRC